LGMEGPEGGERETIEVTLRSPECQDSRGFTGA
jgi:hypothetical protein